MTRLILSRHGETVWHAENRYAGTSDVALNGTGLAQAEALGRWAAGAGLAAVYASNQSRAIDTARPAAAAAGLELRIDERLHEVGFGRGEGLTRAEMHDTFPDALAAFLAGPGRVPFPGGEPGVDAVRRAMQALGEIADLHSGKMSGGVQAGDYCGVPDEGQHSVDGPAGDYSGGVLVVMHSTLLRLVLCHILGIDVDKYRTVFPRIDNVSLTSVDFSDGEWSLHRFNVPLPTASAE